jgi:hypothetical protein
MIDVQFAVNCSQLAVDAYQRPVRKVSYSQGAPMRGMTMNANRLPDTRSIHDYWEVFVGEGGALVALGLLAIVIPSIARVRHFVLELAFSHKWSHRSPDHFLGAASTGILVVSRVCVACDYYRCRSNRSQSTGSLRRADGMAICDGRSAEDDIGLVLFG